MDDLVTDPEAGLLPEPFASWFAEKGWTPRAHQLDLLARARAGRSSLLIAPTGAGKTLAGFLPSLVELSGMPRDRKGSKLHTLYVSPLKALAVDVARNVEMPLAQMGLGVRVETRTGDTPQVKRTRQRTDPPEILMTTPEQIALLIASKEAPKLFQNLKVVILDELHALVTSKRGDLLALGLARLRSYAPGLRVVGLSATVADPDALARWPMPQGTPEDKADLITVKGGVAPDVRILEPEARVPWAGHSGRHAFASVYEAIRQTGTSLVFVNTRSQAEMVFQALWHMNDDGLPIALHHGSLDVQQRRKVEAAMAAGVLRAVVCTSTLDLGIDWGDVDLVIHLGAPKGASRLAQRIGRSNHRFDEPSRALLVSANRFEVMECQAAIEALRDGAQDTPPPRRGGLDVLAQHVLGTACAEAFDAEALYDEIVTAEPYADLDHFTFEKVVDFVATGGYALRAYERYAKIRRRPDGKWRLSHPSIAQAYRLNVGTIVEAPMLKVRLVRAGRSKALAGGRVLGEIEEWFIEQLSVGDTFVFAGQVLRFEGLREAEAYVSRSRTEDPKIPSYQGGKFPLSTYLADRVRHMLHDEAQWRGLPGEVGEWLGIQKARSVVPEAGELLVETFARATRFYMVAYPFEGRLAHQTLGMLLTRRLERARARPLGFVASEYALAIWGLADMGAMVRKGRLSIADLFDEDMLGDDLEAWLDESMLLKRTFRNCAVISGMIERRSPGKEKSGRQVTVSSDLVYDVLREHEPDHILLQATREDAATGLLDIRRLGDMLKRIRGRIRHMDLDRVSPLAVPVMLEIGRERVGGDAEEGLLADAAEDLIEEAMGAGYGGSGARGGGG
ncbi:ligase-associated DNA damage response DEXH box helicase [Lutibaculum baratangense]|uniref:Helicase domain protein n=1 Tax=Lutibaculum baratangense AMV1 TaxID=631454 RepID=V4TKR4_9HYPH|nr:ligase-associated DNA damage response DEXH box helicase [Lutibaculum baratangense]ESR26413.1 Helicase domain protein [Lutibaculum baratangense AMV1]